MEPKLQTISEYREYLELATTQETKSDKDIARVVRAMQAEYALWDLETEALSFIGPVELRNSTVPDVLRLLETRRARAEQQSTPLNDLERCCLAWAGRDGLAGDMREFLITWNNNGGGWYTLDVFKPALRKAGAAGLIKKHGRYWGLKTRT